MSWFFSGASYLQTTDIPRRSIYFVVIGMSWAQGLVKKVQRRLDFSIDIFSPSLNLDKHINRRVWQETLATM